MDEFPSNSNNVRKTPGVKPEPKDEKKVERITQTEVVRRKKPLGRRFADVFVGGDAKGVWGYVMLDVLVPAAKDTIADAFSQGIERMLFGEARSTSRRTGRGPISQNGYVAYNRITGGASSSIRQEDPRMSRRARATHNFDEIILATRVEAQEVIDQMFEVISKYETVSVADLYEMVGIKSDFTDNKWGWDDIRGARVERIRSGYLLDLPRPVPLEN